ncbi:hypothetical protein AGMMS49941_02870 [Deferribacterales bacterium]|nr:hypothetical protein AGMMS49941_02870 [Deferribacterales bacterium]
MCVLTGCATGQLVNNSKSGLVNAKSGVVNAVPNAVDSLGKNVIAPVYATGILQVLLAAELTTNFSSLLYDKTVPSVDLLEVQPLRMLDSGAKFFVLPAKYANANNEITYDESYPRLFGGYLKLRGYGKLVRDQADADYIVVVNVEESGSLTYGKNTSSVAISIYEPDESLVFYAKSDVSSVSDNNFYYRPAKSARPVRYLTLHGMAQLFEGAIPKAFM